MSGNDAEMCNLTYRADYTAQKMHLKKHKKNFN